MSMGPWKWPLLLIAIIILILIGIKVYDFLIRKEAKKQNLNAILFWGCVAAIVGIVGQFSAIWNLLDQIMDASDLSAPMIWMGFLSSFTSTQFGLIILLFSALCWWALKNVYDSLASRL